MKTLEKYGITPMGDTNSPIIERWDKIVAEIEKETDRGAALFTASIIDDLLLELLYAYLLPGKVTSELLEGNRAPIGTFSSRIDMAFVLGLIQPIDRHTCRVIKSIRNDFAHKSDFDFTFQSDRIKTHMHQFQIIHLKEWLGKNEKPDRDTLRHYYIQVIVALLFSLGYRLEMAKTNKLKPLYGEAK